MKLTKSVVFDTERDAEIIEWAETQRISFSEVVRQALALALAKQSQSDPALDEGVLRRVIRTELQAALNGLALAAPLAETSDAEDLELEANLDNLF